MTRKNPKKSKKEEKPKVNKELEGFEIHIDEFGQIKSNIKPEDLNKFLDKNVEDKKLTDREDGKTPTDFLE